MGHMGAKVLHPRAAEITMEEGIPLQIRSVVQSKGGTTIGRSAKSRRPSLEEKLRTELSQASPISGNGRRFELRAATFIAPIWAPKSFIS